MTTAITTDISLDISLEIGMATRPKPGEAFGGDWVLKWQSQHHVIALCIDILGHGHKAHQTGAQATEQLQQWINNNTATEDPATILNQLDQILRNNRGAAAALYSIDTQKQILSFSGIGNIGARKLYPQTTTLVSKDGGLGINMRTPKIYQHPIEAGDIFILHTDGISSRLSYKDYPQLIQHSAQSAAQQIIKQFGKQHDDAGCIIVKINSTPTDQRGNPC